MEYAESYEKISREIFYPIYPVIAKQILEYFGKTKGNVLDVGSGNGYLGIELARNSQFNVVLLDPSKTLLKHAHHNISKANLKDRVRICFGDVHDLPYFSNQFDLVVSRGALYFWKDKAKAFSELNRVIKPDGLVYVGGGFGTAELKDRIRMKMRKLDENWQGFKDDHPQSQPLDEIERALKKSGIIDYKWIEEYAGSWIIFRKQRSIA